MEQRWHMNWIWKVMEWTTSEESARGGGGVREGGKPRKYKEQTIHWKHKLILFTILYLFFVSPSLACPQNVHCRCIHYSYQPHTFFASMSFRMHFNMYNGTKLENHSDRRDSGSMPLPIQYIAFYTDCAPFHTQNGDVI